MESGVTVSRMTYDFAGRLLTRTDGCGTPEARTVSNHYSAGGLVDAIVYTGSGGTFTTTYGYDAFGRRVSVGGDREPASRTVYDTANRVAAVIDGNGNRTVYGYDGFGRPATQTTGTGAEAATSYSFYDAGGNLVQSIDGAGNRRYFAYDALNRRTDESIPSQSPLPAGWQNNPQFVLSHGDYNNWNEAVAMRDAAGGMSTAVYDALGQRRQSTDANGLTLTYDYDALGRMTVVHYPPVSTSGDGTPTTMSYQFDPERPELLQSVTDRAGNTTSYSFDPRGLKLTEVSSLGGTTTYSYDALGRVALTTDPFMNSTAYGYDQFAQVTAIVYPDDGSGNDRIESRSYDDFGRLTGQSGAGQYALDYGYDAAGNLTSMTDGNGSTTRWEFDSCNRMRRKIFADGSHYDYGYNGDGTIATRTDARGVVTLYGYNASGLMTAIRHAQSAPVGFEYDGLGRMTRMLDATGTTGYGYTPGGLMTTCTQSSTGRVLSFAHDAAGNRTGRIVSGSTDSGDSTAWRTLYAYDPAGRLEQIYDGKVSLNNPFKYFWKSNGNLVDHVGMPGGAIQWKGYDQGGRLTAISFSVPAGGQSSPVNSLSFSYNALSMRQSEQNAILNTGRTFAYDALRQLKEVDTVSGAQGATASYTYSYDPIGNWLMSASPGLTLSCSSNNVNEYVAISGNGPTALPQYDANGNMTDSGTGTHYDWDDENRLVRVTWNGRAVEFTYNGQGWRVEKRVYDGDGATPQKRTRFVYDGVNLIEELDVSPSTNRATTVRTYTIGLDLSQSPDGAGGVGGLLAVTDAAGNASYFYSYDGNGNVTDLTDSNGNMMAHYDYSPFGVVTNSAGDYAAANPFRWSTKFTDDETGLVYYGFRYYDPGSGRWMSRDPIGEDGGVNLNAFVENDPSNATDDLGLVLYAVGGTNSAKDNKNWRNKTNVRRFYDDFVAPGNKLYDEGPGAKFGGLIFGRGTGSLADKGYKFICSELGKQQNSQPWLSDPVFLIGHSRGGLAVMEVSEKLKQGCPCFDEKGHKIKGPIPVKFMGLYDAVSMTPNHTSGPISENVQFAAHGMRDPTTGSRSGWGNTGQSGAQILVIKHFDGNHSAMGGDPTEGDKLNSLDLRQNARSSREIDVFIRNNARRHGAILNGN